LTQDSWTFLFPSFLLGFRALFRRFHCDPAHLLKFLCGPIFPALAGRRGSFLSCSGSCSTPFYLDTSSTPVSPPSLSFVCFHVLFLCYFGSLSLPVMVMHFLFFFCGLVLGRLSPSNSFPPGLFGSRLTCPFLFFSPAF